jgi:hypothetical protein
MNKLLTIGMATYDDFNGVYFSIQALKMYHDICNTRLVEFVVVDNNPDSDQGKWTKEFIKNWVKGKYIPYTEKKSTTVRNLVFENSSADYTMCIDPHVMVEKNGIDVLLKYYEDHPDCKDLVQGPLWYDGLDSNMATQFDPIFRSHMYGIWGNNKEAYNKGEPFEIPMQGLGLFSCKTSSWQGFNKRFVGFGAEEGYIHEKFRQAGGKCICIPQLKWIHRFKRPGGVQYPLCLEDRVWNYFIGWLEIHKDPEHQMIKDIYNHFKDKLPKGRIDTIFKKAIDGDNNWR